MTTIYQTVLKQTEHRTFISRACDKCGCDMPEDYGNAGFSRREFTLTYLSGESYPEVGSMEGWSVVDLCDACVASLRALLVQAGYRVTEIQERY